MPPFFVLAHAILQTQTILLSHPRLSRLRSIRRGAALLTGALPPLNTRVDNVSDTVTKEHAQLPGDDIIYINELPVINESVKKSAFTGPMNTLHKLLKCLHGANERGRVEKCLNFV